jgi:hypothetical protein
MTQYLLVPILVDFILVSLVCGFCFYRISLKDRGSALWPVPIFIWTLLRAAYDLVFVIDLLDGIPVSTFFYNYWSLFIQIEAHITIGILVLQFLCKESLIPGLVHFWQSIVSTIQHLQRSILRKHG